MSILAAALAFTATVPALSAVQDNKMTVAANGMSKAVIVVANSATEAERHAATELQFFLNKVTGADFQISGLSSSAMSRILVGPDAAKLADPKFSIKSLGTDGIVIRSIGSDLVLAGGRPRGTLYAVYTFLEDIIGCHWWTPDDSFIPHKPTLKINSLNVKYIPQFEYREPMWGSVRGDKDWTVRNKVVSCLASGSVNELADTTWKSDSDWNSISSIGYGHTFDQYSKWDAFGQHPEFFSEIDGKRLLPPAQTQLCLSNKEMRTEFIKSVRWSLGQRPFKPKGLWISQNDWYNNCQCSGCKAANAKYGSPAGLLIDFVNDVAKDLQKDYPDTDIWTLAYDWTQVPPKGIKPHKNVVIWLATTGCDRSKPLTSETNKVFYQRLQSWAKIADRIYIWDYLTNFQHYLQPHPNISSLGPNAAVFAHNNVKGVRGQGSHDAVGAEFSELKAWVQAKLYWDPSLNSDTLTNQFIKGYYGSSAQYIKKYIKLIQASADKANLPLDMGEPPTAKYLIFDTLIKANSLLKSAESAAANDTERLRVQTLQLGIQYVFMCRWDELWFTAKDNKIDWPLPQTLDETYAQFMDTAKKAGITRFSEAGVRDWMPSITQKLGRKVAPPPPGCENLSRDKWADLQDGGFVRTTYLDDPEASDGKMVVLPAGVDLVYECWRVPFLTTSGGKNLKLKMSVKCNQTRTFSIGDNNIQQAPVFSVGIKQGNDNVIMEAKTFNIGDIKAQGYQTYDLGVHDLSAGWIWIWLKASENANVRQVTVDRMWLIRE